jgi:hypothetical protein
VQLVLQINERVVGLYVKSDVAQNTGYDEGTDLCRLSFDDDFVQVLGFVFDAVAGLLSKADVGPEGSCDTFDTK